MDGPMAFAGVEGDRSLGTCLGTGGLAALVTIMDSMFTQKRVKDDVQASQGRDNLAFMPKGTRNHAGLTTLAYLPID